MKVLFINPSVGYYTRALSNPLGLLSIATYVKNNGHQVRLEDRCVNKMNINKLLDSYKPDIIGISLMSSRGILDASKVLPRRVIFVSIIAMVLSILEFLIFCLPSAFSHSFNEAVDSIMLRLIFIFLGLVSLMVSFCAEHLISIPRNNGENRLLSRKEELIIDVDLINKIYLKCIITTYKL